jgi:hypothetical protein
VLLNGKLQLIINVLVNLAADCTYYLSFCQPGEEMELLRIVENSLFFP